MAAPDRAATVEAARRLLGEGMARRTVAKQLGVPESTLRRWVKAGGAA
jgi:transposase